MKIRHIPVAKPALVGNEKKYVLDCLETNWISSHGKYIQGFEEEFAEFCQARHANSCCNGTVALHLALLALGISQGDEVIMPTLSYIATANAVVYCGGRPVFVDSVPDTWNIDPTKIEEKITPRTKAIIVVHLYGQPVDMDAVQDVAKRHGLFVVEDAAEAHGAEYHGQRVGAIGDIGVFSFFGNKIITTGEGGMVVTHNEELDGKVRQLKMQGVDPNRRYWFPMIGYNYRMTNVTAAIGLGQLECVNWHLEQHQNVASWYKSILKARTDFLFQAGTDDTKHAYWMVSLIIQDGDMIRDRVIEMLAERGIETRPLFYPMHLFPPYLDAVSKYPIAERIGRQGITLPSWSQLTRDEVDFVCENLCECVDIARAMQCSNELPEVVAAHAT